MTVRASALVLLLALNACAGGPGPAPVGQAVVSQPVTGEFQEATELFTSGILVVMHWRVQQRNMEGSRPYPLEVVAANPKTAILATQSAPALFSFLGASAPDSASQYRARIVILESRQQPHTFTGRFSVGGRQYCGGRWQEAGTTFEVHAERSSTTSPWRGATVRWVTTPDADPITVASACEFVNRDSPVLPASSRIPTMVLDTATVLESIANNLIGIARFSAQDSRIHPIRIDTTFADWDRAVARVIRRKDPAVLPTLPDSVAYYTDLWSVAEVRFERDSVFVRLLSTGCSPPSQGSGSGIAWSWEVLTRDSPVLRQAPRAPMGSGGGRCEPFGRPGLSPGGIR